MEIFWKTVDYLKDPQKVADFQRYFGVEAVPVMSQNGKNGFIPQCDSPANGTMDHVYLNGSSNGFVKSLSETHLKHQNGLINGVIPNGVSKSIISKGEQIDEQIDFDNNTVKRTTDWAKKHIHKNGSAMHQKTHCQYVAKITNSFYYYLFSFGAALGNEIFYITFFPWLMWNFDAYIARCVMINWAIVMYIGQATKDIIGWPRPPSPPVVRMEERYAQEFGTPSTHAMMSVGIPVSLLVFMYSRYEFPLYAGIIIAAAWCSLVSLSRLYLGMHTVLDVVSGLIYGSFLLMFTIPYTDMMDHFQSTHPYAPVVMFSIMFLASYYYPQLKQWSTTRGDTYLVISLGIGIGMGSWMFNYLGQSQPPEVIYPISLAQGTITSMCLCFIRLGCGVLILCLARKIIKAIFIPTYFLVTKQDRNNFSKIRQELSFELPYTLLIYFTMSFMTSFCIPVIFKYINIHREEFYTELL